MVTTVRYHIKLSKKRTTITMDTIISNLLAIKIGVNPRAANTHGLVRAKLEALMKPFVKPDKRTFLKPSQRVTEQVILYLIDDKLSKKYLRYFVK